MATANASGHLHVPAQSKAPYDEETLATLRADAQRIIERYPQSRSALLPMLHLIQSVDGYVTGRGIALCAELLGLSTAEVSGVATFYTQFKRHPNGDYTVGVCTNTLCAIMGGDQIWDHISDYLGIGHDETTTDGKITLEKVECNAACDYAPVVMVNWEFYDNQTPQSTQQLVDDLRSGADLRPSRGPLRQCTFKEVSRVLAGFHDGLADEGVGAGAASTLGLRIAKERGWTAPAGPAPAPIAEQLTPVDANAAPAATAPATLFDAAAGSAGTAGSAGPAADGDGASPFGPGTARPGPDGRGPDGWDIKGNADSMLFHTPQSPWYGRTKAEVWFRDEDSAQAAGFTDARTRRRQSKAAGKDQA